MKSFQEKLERILREGNTDTKVLKEDQEHSPCAVQPEAGEDVTKGVIDGTGKIDATGPVKHTGDSTLKTNPGSTTAGPTGHLPTNADLPRPQLDGLDKENKNPGKKVYGLHEEEEEDKKAVKEEKKELPPFMKKGHKEPDADNKGGKSDKDADNKKGLKEEEEDKKELKEEGESQAAATLKLKPQGAGEKADKLKEETDQEEGETNKEKLGVKEEAEDDKDDKKAVKEATTQLFAGETISEALKEKTAAIFEATLSQRIKDYRKVLTERFTKQLNDRVETIREELSESVNGHLDLVVEHWVKENEVPLERAIKAELVEEFIGELKTCFENHYIELPQEKVDVVSEMADRIGKLETKLNEQISTSVNLQKQVKLYERSEVFDKVSKGLAATQVEKLRSLSENVEFKTGKQFETALKTLKENVDSSTQKTNVESKKTLSEQTLEQSPETTVNSGMFDSVKESMARMAKS